MGQVKTACKAKYLFGPQVYQQSAGLALTKTIRSCYVISKELACLPTTLGIATGDSGNNFLWQTQKQEEIKTY